MKYKVLWVPLGILAVVVLLCIVLVRQQTSPLVTVTQWVNDKFEGFQSSPTTSPTCPSATRDTVGAILTPAYSFYTDATGESLCCLGTIDPVSHTCKPSTQIPNSRVCAFRPGVPDPRNPQQTLPLCTAVTDAVTQSNGTSICPRALPKYANDGATSKQSCCATATNLDGTDCISTDLQAGNFCRVKPAPGEKNCGALKNFEDAQCPPNLQKINYAMGSTETSVYPKAAGATVPLCFGIQHSCFPDATVNQLQQQGVFTSQPSDPTKWGFACSGYQKYYVNKDYSDPSFNTSYVS